ncbi:hypothetical protein Ahy_A02g005131 [Arachis hypogaea]|uniref:Uncharacterized protein n=1 Tax=Arachis hypogaea TaxID=3818 RepID=A0A445E5X3_ARAHY|nr:hypothetical protein Ahy_A02g005131 [Arachis hypogaea]
MLESNNRFTKLAGTRPVNRFVKGNEKILPGIGPVNRFRLRSRSWSTGPVNWFRASDKYSIEGGKWFGPSEPDRALCFKSTRDRVFDSNRGVEPVSLLWQSMRLVSSGKDPIAGGITPASWLKLRSTVLNSRRPPNPDGISPEMKFRLIPRNLKFFKSEIDSGNLPKLGKRREFPNRPVYPTGKTGRAGSRVAKVKRNNPVRITEHAGEVAGIGSEVPIGEKG